MKVFLLAFTIVSGVFFPVILGAEGEEEAAAATVKPLPICPPRGGGTPTLEAPPGAPVVDHGTDLLLVSTLDGKLTALDPSRSGREVWSVTTKPGEMLSSTISQMELTNNARWVRLIPSLAGGLYKFDGEVVEPVPLDAESLLKSSLKFADGTVMTGGKESRTYGLDAKTGQIRYECGIEGCHKGKDGFDDSDDVIIVQRETQTVRAVEPRSGTEKWNFSVSQHRLEFHSGLQDLCDDDTEGDTIEDYDFLDEGKTEDSEIKAVVSDGVICSVDKSDPEVINWKKKFGTPIVHAWRMTGGRMFKVNLFSHSRLPKKHDGSDRDADPILYVGTFANQLYIQESLPWRPSSEDIHDIAAHMPRVTWRPYLITADSRTPIINHGSDPGATPLPSLSSGNAEKTALAVFHHPDSGYPYDAGWYLYPEEPNLAIDHITEIANSTEVVGEEEKKESQTIQVVFVSLWYWWKEVVFISFITAILMNIIITRPYIENLKAMLRRRRTTEVRYVPYEVQVEIPVPKTPDTATGSLLTSSSEVSSGEGGGSFLSRYVQDYEPVSCLGAGGFGVVFESKNKLDDVHYAVKRVKLPASEKAKKKVLREVKCLAKLDHKHIVRYFTTWLEYPPAGWQDARDEWWKRSGADGDHLPSQTDTFERNPFSFPISATETSLKLDRNQDSLVIDFEGKASSHDTSGGIDFLGCEASKEVPSASKAAVGDKTRSKFWKDSTDTTEATSDEKSLSCCDALDWEEQNNPKRGQEDNKPNAPHVYLYIVMQLCQRESLKSWLRAGKHERLLSLRMFREICSGVEYVHSQGLIHRDLKPSNIFFSNDGTVKIGDFGLVTEHSFEDEDVQWVSQRPDLAAGDNLACQNQHTLEVGTESYMSPEQLARQNYDHKVDIYSMGLILFELLVPFSTQMERAFAMADIRKLKFPSGFDKTPEHGLVKLMLSTDPDMRPETTDILESDLLVTVPDVGLSTKVRSRQKTTSSTSSDPIEFPTD